jgi:RsiW-degrading membrane proteinase PrsW (M82 family)
LFFLALAPIFICVFYIYIRDKYEKEPIRLLFTGLIFSAIISVMINFTEKFLEKFYAYISYDDRYDLFHAFYDSFIISGLTEEFFKYLVLFFLIWYEKNFNEPFDGIVYATVISLGFAMIENILYVLHPHIGGADTGFYRAIFSVPGHAMFGIAMGYFFSLAKYEHDKRNIFLVKAFVIPVILHGTFNFILLSNIPYAIILLVLYSIYLHINVNKKIKIHLNKSPFKLKT